MTDAVADEERLFRFDEPVASMFSVVPYKVLVSKIPLTEESRMSEPVALICLACDC